MKLSYRIFVIAKANGYIIVDKIREISRYELIYKINFNKDNLFVIYLISLLN